MSTRNVLVSISTPNTGNSLTLFSILFDEKSRIVAKIAFVDDFNWSLLSALFVLHSSLFPFWPNCLIIMLHSFLSCFPPFALLSLPSLPIQLSFRLPLFFFLFLKVHLISYSVIHSLLSFLLYPPSLTSPMFYRHYKPHFVRDRTKPQPNLLPQYPRLRQFTHRKRERGLHISQVEEMIKLKYICGKELVYMNISKTKRRDQKNELWLRKYDPENFQLIIDITQ